MQDARNQRLIRNPFFLGSSLELFKNCSRNADIHVAGLSDLIKHALDLLAFPLRDRSVRISRFLNLPLIFVQLGKEFNAVWQYQSGGATYASDGIYVLSSLIVMRNVTHSIPLPQGWNMISSFVSPKAGYYQVVFQANSLSSGVYFYTISTESYRASKKLMLIK
jgi:hypothetical protein